MAHAARLTLLVTKGAPKLGRASDEWLRVCDRPNLLGCCVLFRWRVLERPGYVGSPVTREPAAVRWRLGGLESATL